VKCVFTVFLNESIYSLYGSVATARLQTAEPAEPSCFEPSQAGLPANDQIWLGLARELGLAG